MGKNKPTCEELEQKVKELEGQSAGTELSAKITNKANSVWSGVLDAIPDLVSLHDPDYRIVRVNKALADFLGKKPEELIGKYCYNLFHGTDEPLEDCPHTKVMESGQAATEQVNDPHIGCPLLVSATPIYADDGKLLGSIHIAKDITEHKRAEEAFRRQHQIQSVLNKMLSVSLKPYSLEEMLSNILDYIVSVPWLTLESKAAIFLVEDQPEMLVMKSFRKFPPEQQILCARVPFGQCLCGKAAQTKKIQFTNHIDKRHENRYKGMPPHGHYCVPILSSGHLLGVLSLYVKEGHRQNKEEEDFLLAITQVLAGIIERKRAEENLQLFRDLVNQSNDAVFIIDPQTSRFLDFNDKACASLGYLREELLSLGVQNIEAVLPDNFSWKKHVQKVREKGNMVLEGVHKRKDGSTFPVEVSVKWITQEKKNCLVAIARDITERQRAGEQLRQLYRAVEQSPVSIVITDADGTIEYVNPTFTQITGYSSREALGENPRLLKSGEQTAKFYKQLWKKITSGKVWRGEFHNKKKNGKLYWESASISPITNAEGLITHFVAVKEDITERKQAEEELRARQREIENLNATLEQRVHEEVEKSLQKDFIMMHQSRLAAMGEMIGNIAHQWKQPLNALNILLYNIKDFFDQHEQDQHQFDNFIEKGYELIMKMATTVDDFRYFFKPNKEKEEFSVNDIIKVSLSLVDDSFKYDNISVTVNETEEVTVLGFPNEFSQVILNMLTNAKDAIMARGTKGKIRIDIVGDNNNCVVKVKDNGGGVPEELFDNIFDPYCTTKEEAKGTGIGLYMCKVIVEDHMNGSIEVRNSRGGAEFKIKIPLLTSKSENKQ
jgi:PAS domain S-box-containing protein